MSGPNIKRFCGSTLYIKHYFLENFWLMTQRNTASLGTAFLGFRKALAMYMAKKLLTLLYYLLKRIFDFPKWNEDGRESKWIAGD